MVVKAITHYYEEDSIPCQRVIGICNVEEVSNKLQEIKDAMANVKITNQVLSTSSSNFSIEFEDGNMYYSGDYVLNELNF